MVIGSATSSAGIWAPVVGLVSAAFITTAGGIVVSRAQKAANNSKDSATQADKSATEISAERQLIKTLETSFADMRERLMAVEIREERCQRRLMALEERKTESEEALRDASLVQKTLEHEVEDLRDQVETLQKIIERRKRPR